MRHTPEDSRAGGYYRSRNTVYIFPVRRSMANGLSYDDVLSGGLKNYEGFMLEEEGSLRDIVFHESTHFVLNRLFGNISRPYERHDYSVARAHNEAVKGVLWNVIGAMLELDFYKGGVVGRSFYPRFDYDGEMGAEELATNVLGLRRYLDFRIEEKYLPEGWFREADMVMLDRILDGIFLVFNSYEAGSRDVEFITNVYGKVTVEKGGLEGKMGEILKPYTEYLVKYVMPRLREELEGHGENWRLVG